MSLLVSIARPVLAITVLAGASALTVRVLAREPVNTRPNVLLVVMDTTDRKSVV